MKSITDLFMIDARDPLKEVKLLTIQGVNRLSDWGDLVKRDMENKFLVVLAIICSAFLSSFIALGQYMSALIFGEFIIIFLLIAWIKAKIQVNQIRHQLNFLADDAKKKWGMDLRQK